MSNRALSLLALAKGILGVPTIAKGEWEDPDAIDPRAEGSTADPDAMGEAREEAQSGQQAQGAEGGAPGAPGEGGEEPDWDEGQPGPGDGDGDEPVNKEDVVKSIRFLADAHGISLGEIAKGFSGVEGDPAEGVAPVGRGVELLESIVSGVNQQGKVLEAIAEALHGLVKQQVSLGGDVAKALTGIDEARTAHATLAQTVADLPKTAPALPSKGAAPEQIAKAIPEGGARPTSEDLFQMALRGEVDPATCAAANRRINYSTPRG